MSKNTIRAVTIKPYAKIELLFEVKSGEDKLKNLKPYLQQKQNAITVAATPNEETFMQNFAISQITEKKATSFANDDRRNYCDYPYYYYYYYYYYYLQLSCHSVAVDLTLVQTKQIRICINETIQKHSTNNTKHSKYKYTYYQNAYTLQNPHIHTTTYYKTS